MHRSRFYVPFVILAFLMTLAFSAGTASAGNVPPYTYTVDIISANCNQLTVSYVLNAPSSGGSDFAELFLTADGDLIHMDPTNPYEETVVVNFVLPPRPTPYLLVVTVEISGYATGSDSISVTCSEGPTSGQLCFGRGAVAATVFIYANRFDIYAIDPEDNGELVMSFTQEYLATLPKGDTKARLLGDSDRHIPIEFYRNVNGRYRMLAGPDGEGKLFECTFDGACSFERSWIGAANTPTDEIVPKCDPVEAR